MIRERNNKSVASHFWLWAEMARRKKMFHHDEEWENIRLWGLMNWGEANPFLKSGELLTAMRRENKTIWVWPTPATYYNKIEPLLGVDEKTLARLAGWEI